MRGGGGGGTERQGQGRREPTGGRAKSERGEGASDMGKVDEREREKGKLRESGEEKRAENRGAAQQISPVAFLSQLQ